MHPPSAELRYDQTDQDTLPSYEMLDEIVRMYVEENKSLSEIITSGYSEDIVKYVTHLIKINEHKRRQITNRNSYHSTCVR